ncbi:hypothetical protein EC988_004075 [Linderina pennispora]|nr:hypothetical protein EC988_004075 [Linderina pennispora]
MSTRRMQSFAALLVVGFVTTIAIFMFAQYTDSMQQSGNYLSLTMHQVYVIGQRNSTNRRWMMARQMEFQGIPFAFARPVTAADIDHPEKYMRWVGEEEWKAVPQNRTLSSEDLAAYRTHMNVINDVIRLEYKSALVLDNLVDMEVDIKDQMRDLVEVLPKTWDIVYVGHCGHNNKRPTAFAKNVFVSTRPECTYAYAVSQQGARRLKRALDNIWPNPRVPFDQELIKMVEPEYLEAYSVEPPLFALVRPARRQGTVRHGSVTHLLHNSTLNWMGRPSLYALLEQQRFNKINGKA